MEEPAYSQTDPSGEGPTREDSPQDANAYRYAAVVNRPVSHVYARWLLFEDLPLVVDSLCRLQKIDDTHFVFTLSVDGVERQTRVAVLLRVPERRIAWQAESKTFETGVLLFDTVPDKSTEVSVRIRSPADPQMLSAVVLACLARFKTFAEQP